MSISEMIMPVLIPSGLSKFKNAGILLLVLSELPTHGRADGLGFLLHRFN